MAASDKIYRIVVGVDYSSTAELALDRAFALAAREPRAEVHAVSVLSGITGGPRPDVPSANGYGMSLQDASEQLKAYLGERLTAWQKTTGGTFSACIGHIRTDFPAGEIAQLGADLEADLIVVGTHGRRGVRRLVLGSVAEGVVRMAQGTVLVVRPEHAGEDMPQIEPPCPRCLETRQATEGKQLWCAEHRERHGQRHTHQYEGRALQPGSFPLVARM